MDAFDPNAEWYGLLGVNYSNPTFVAQVINGVCTATTTYCTGANQQYPSMAACTATLSNVSIVPVGDPTIAGNLNDLTCRATWMPLLSSRPSVHCPTMGPNPGLRCNTANHTYESYYTNSPKLFKQSFYADPQNCQGNQNSQTVVTTAAYDGSTSNGNGSSGSTAWIAVGATVGGLVLIAMAAALVVLKRKQDELKAKLNEVKETHVLLADTPAIVMMN